MPPKYFPSRFWPARGKKPHTLLHLVDEAGQPVDAELRAAVEAAFKRAVQRFPRIDEAVMADMAESVAAAIARRRGDIRAVKQYALVAMNGKVMEWLRRHPSLEIAVSEAADLEMFAGGAEDAGYVDIELKYLFDQMKIRLSERDRQILVLIEQGCGNPSNVASALGLTYMAAAKAIQRTREHVAEILSGAAVRTRVSTKAVEGEE